MVDHNPSQKRMDIARDLGITPSTLNSVVAKRKNVEPQASAFHPGSEQARTVKHAELEQALLVRSKRAQAFRVNIDASILQGKAQDIAELLDIMDFACSNGWIYCSRRATEFRIAQ